MSDDALETLLEHWSRWIVGRRWKPSTCQSAEKHFRPERVADDEARRPAPKPFSEPELIACEKAVCSLPLPLGTLIRMVYVRHRDPCAAMRVANVQPKHRGAWPLHRSTAFGMLRQALRTRSEARSAAG